MDYHLPYYRELFEGYGFKTYFHQYTYYRPVNPKGLTGYPRKAERISP
jgi:hypothetical protein